jgi:hypothetical protein
MRVPAGVLVLAWFAGLAVRGAEFDIWKFDRLENIGGYRTKVEGHPRMIDTPAGKAVEFDGVDDALFIEDHPLAGAATFTWEVIFRPSKGGNPEQRFFSFERAGSENGRGHGKPVPVRDPGEGRGVVSGYFCDVADGIEGAVQFRPFASARPVVSRGAGL